MEIGNPIPVNGPIGEQTYLSRLETIQGERILFHRIGAINMIDVFEAVTYSGSEWFIFFLDSYHPRRSRNAPQEFRMTDHPRQFSGFHNYCDNFPYDFVDTMQAVQDIFRLAFISLENVILQIEQKAFNRPMAHKVKLDEITAMLSSRSNV